MLVKSRPSLNSSTAVGGAAEEIPFFFGQGLFGTIHKPVGCASPGWILCGPFGKEKTNSQRLGFEWARTLAATGCWVLRFDYRGTGDSGGSFEEFTIDEYLEDIDSARTELERFSGMNCRGFIGLRLGASLAAISAAGSLRDLEIVMWEPVVEGARYRDSLLRTAMANELVNSNGPGRSRSDLRRDLAAGKSVSVDGFALKNPMYESLASIDLRTLGRPTSGRILIVNIKARKGQSTPSAIADLVELYSRGGETCLEVVEEPPVWMKTRTYHWHLTDLFGTTLEWMNDQQPMLSKPNQTVAIETGTLRDGKFVDHPVSFAVEGTVVRGILHQPRDPRHLAPAIVLVAAGEACRSAFFYPHLARGLADAGWSVMRFDPRGIGDSDGDLGCSMLPEVFARVEDGALVPDTLAAMDFMESRWGTREFILAGLCGGAITAIRAAEIDGRVAGIVPLELPMRLTPRAPADRQSRLSSGIPWHELLPRMRGAYFLLKARRLYHAAKNFRRRAVLVTSSLISQGSSRISRNPAWYRKKIGDDASCSMLAALEGALERGVWVHCVFADTEQPELFEAVLPGLLSDRPPGERLVTFHVVQGADHNFTMPGSADELFQSMVSYLEEPRLPWAGLGREEPEAT